MLGVRDGYQNDAACTAVRAVRCPIVDGRTQWMVLSAPINNPEVASCQGGTHGGLLRFAVAKHSVIVESDVVVGRRSRHRADVLGRRPQGPDCRRCHQRAALCPLARVLAASSARRSRPSELVSTICHGYVPPTRATRLVRSHDSPKVQRECVCFLHCKSQIGVIEHGAVQFYTRP